MNYKEGFKANETLYNKSIKSEIILLESDVYILRVLRDIEKTLLSMGAYSIKNMETQAMKFDNANVPEWERIINAKSWNIKREYVHILYNRYNDILLKMESHIKEFKLDGKT